MSKILIAGLLSMMLMTGSFATPGHLSERQVKYISSLIKNPAIIKAIQISNSENKSIDDMQIQILDQQWRSELNQQNKPLINRIDNNTLSKLLKKIQDNSKGYITEIMVMDDKGLLVGISKLTSDYWQGDEAKWLDTYAKGSKKIHVSNVDFDESTQQFQQQISSIIINTKTKQAIGAITIGLSIKEH